MIRTFKKITDSTFDAFDSFLHLESASSILMIIAMAAALLTANSHLAEGYMKIWETKAGITLGPFSLNKHLILWINDGLMAVFFLFVGLEIKRELLQGELSSVSKALLPVVGAAGGAVLPAIIYYSVNHAGYADGWGIPMATDIAFAIGLLALLGKSVPSGLKVFLASLAVVDDLMAVVVIAVFYTDSIAMGYLYSAAVVILIMFLLNRAKVSYLTVYLLFGAVLWYFTLKAGVHATVAGVITAVFIPSEPKIGLHGFSRFSRAVISGINNDESLTKEDESQLHKLGYAASNIISPLSRLEQNLHALTAFFIMPLFVFANMGITMDFAAVSEESVPVSLGIIAGLFIGKPVGIVTTVYAFTKTGLVSLPDGVTMRHIIGAGILAGVGLTMSIFISTMAFDGDMLNSAKMAVLYASLMSAVVGLFVLKRVCRN